MRQILSGGFGAGNVPIRRPIEPHRAFAAQAYDAAPDQYVGAGLLEQASRLLFGLVLVPLLGVRCVIDAYSLDALELPQLVEQQALVFPVFVALEMRDRDGEVPGRGAGERAPLEAR